MGHPPVLSIVDYAAWEKGYMPPTEHALIDQLAYRGAKVVTMSDFGTEAYWLVMRGKFVRGRKLFAIKQAIEDALDMLAEEESKPPQRFTIVNDGPDRFVLADAESDEPTAPVYATAAEAEAALAERLREMD